MVRPVKGKLRKCRRGAWFEETNFFEQDGEVV